MTVADDDPATRPAEAEPAPVEPPPSAVEHPTRKRRVPLLVLLAVLAQLMLGIGWSVLQPPYKGLDEPAHVVGVLQLVYHHDWPAPRDLPFQKGVYGTYLNSIQGQTSGSHVNATPPTPRGQRPSLEADGGAASQVEPKSQMAQHPPLYYAGAAAVLRVLPGEQSWQYDRLVWTLRLLSALLICPVPLLAFYTMRRFSRDRHVALAASFVPLLLPGLAREAGSVTNDSLLILLLSVLTLGVARIVTGDASRRTAAWVGVVGMLALFTKGTALFLPAWLILAYAWCWWRTRQRVWAAVLTAAVPVAIGLLWWVRNAIEYGAVQPAGGDLAAPGHPASGVRHFAAYFFSAFSYRFWATLGNPEPPALDRGLAQDATFTVLALLVVGAAVLVVRAVRRAGAAVRPGPAHLELGGLVAAAILLFSTVAMLGIVASGSLHTYHQLGRIAGVQGRYVYPSLLALMVLPLLGTAAILRGRLRPLVPVAVLVMATLLQLAGGVEAMRTIWQPAGGSIRDGIRVLQAWSPWPQAGTDAIFAVLGLVALALAVTLLTTQVRELIRPAAATD